MSTVAVGSTADAQPEPALRGAVVGVATSRGRCDYQEDRVSVELLRAACKCAPGPPPRACGCSELLFLAVFDGHAGSAASRYAKTHFHRNVARALSGVSDLEDDEDDEDPDDDDDGEHRDDQQQDQRGESWGKTTLTSQRSPPPKQRGEEVVVREAQKALVEACKRTDAKFLDSLDDGGTTAVSCLVDLRARYAHVANVGDSRLVVGSLAGDARGPVVSLATTDHKPNLPEERARIEAAGHTVEQDRGVELDEFGRRVKEVGVWRVDGAVAVSRSIGDAQLKDYGVEPESQAVTCIPQVLSKRLTAADRFVLLACDGVWDLMTSEEVVAFVSERMGLATAAENHVGALTPITQEKAQEIASALVTHVVVDLGGTDNTTVVLAALLW